ncbi:ribonuclease H-like domain-containing protein, partial [Tanacetum coccineum]
KAVVSDNKGNEANAVKALGNPQLELQENRVIDSGCSRHMTGNKSYLLDYEEIDGGFVAFGGNSKGGKITRKGKIRTGKLDFEDVYFVKELKFNLFSVSQMCDKKNNVLFTDTECVVLSSDFKLLDESQVLLRVPRKDNMYSVNLRNVVLSGGLTCLFEKATLDESNLWHRKLGHINFKTMNKLDPVNEGDKDDQDLRDEFKREFERLFVQGKEAEININSTNSISVVSSPINTARIKDVDDEPMMPNLEYTGIFGYAYNDEDFCNNPYFFINVRRY